MDIYYFIQNHIDISKKKRGEEPNGQPLEFWINVILEGLDGAWRSGANASNIVTALQMAQNKSKLPDNAFDGKPLNYTPEKWEKHK